MLELRDYTLGELTWNHNAARRPIKSSERCPGDTPYYGASGVVDWVEGFTHDGEFLLVSEDGENLRSRATPIAFPARGRIWVNNHAHVLTGRMEWDTKFLQYALAVTDVSGYLTGSAQPKLSKAALESIRLRLPAPRDRAAIAELLGALDDKMAANRRVASQTLRLADALYLREAAAIEVRLPLGKMATTVLGGTPSRSVAEYWSGGTVPWITSGKANNDRILEPSERITEEALAKSAAKMMPAGTTVIAITGATLGQVARLEIPSSGNQSLVGIWSEDPAVNDWLYFAVRHEIGSLMKHATGAAQQHVNKGAVESMVLPRPVPERLPSWGANVRPLLDTAASADRESLVLAATRDELLPLLLSGKVYVKAAERAVQGVL